MATPDHEKLEQLFSAALEHDSWAERSAFLDSACGTDSALRQHVEGLLRANERVGSFLDTPAVDLSATVASLPAGQLLGTLIGRYKVLEEIGAGGFGVVYLAQQEEPVRRRVALKIIKLGMDTREVISRFEAERQALALMDHPNIARVLDAGATDRGRPYFVMELARGVRITEYCDAHKLTVAERVRLLLPVCHAVQHAHQKGIIHRDLKPSNVLVTLQDGQPVAKVIDFGIAKATGQRLTPDTCYTSMHQFLGTPEYMSPDQLDGGLDIDTRTDVYSLGALLYELLTGVTPFERSALQQASFDEIKRIIRDVEPLRPSARVQAPHPDRLPRAAARRAEPSALARALRGDLDWIVMRALEKNRTQRYATAKDLADDLERQLRNEPVLAGPPGPAYRLRKFIVRHRLGVLTGSITAVALLAGLVLATVGLIQAHRSRMELAAERDAARLARVAEHEQRARADARAAEARAHAARSAKVSEFLREMLRSVDPSLALGREVTVRYVLDEAAAKISTGALTDEPEVEAALRLTLGETYVALGLYASAEDHLHTAYELQRGALGPAHRDTLYAARALACLLRVQGQFAAAEALLRETAAAQEQVLGPEHPETLATSKELALALWGPRRFDEAEAIHRRTLEVERRTLGEAHPDTIESLGHVGSVCLAQGRTMDAEPLLVRALELSRLVLGEDHPETGSALQNLGQLREAQGTPALAEPLFCRAYEIDCQVLGRDHPRTAICMNDLLRVRQKLGQTAAIRPLIVERLARLRRAADRPEADARTLHMYAWDLLHCEPVDLRDPHAALPAARRAVDLDGGLDPSLLETLALAYRRTGDLDAAIATQRAALDRARAGASHDRTELEARLIEYLMTRGDVAEAARVSWEDLAGRLVTSFLGGAAPGDALVRQSETLLRDGRAVEAARVLSACLALREKELSSDHWLVADTRGRLGAALAAAGQQAEAEALLLDAQAAAAGNRQCPVSYRRQAVQRLVRLYESWGRPAQAAEWRGKLETVGDRAAE